jgi:hypothetical protein
MTRRERLQATLRGEPVDRPPVSFYEITGLEDTSAADPFNIYADPSWAPLIELARDQSDRIVMRGVAYASITPDPLQGVSRNTTWIAEGSRFTRRAVRAGGRTLTARTRRDRDVNTVWTEEHLLKDLDDLRAFLDVPPAPGDGTVDPSTVLEAEAALGETGIAMIDTPDPLCQAASLFSMADYTLVALTEPAWFHRLLERFAAPLMARTEAVARALPGRLWRIYGPEYATPPFLPPACFRDYVCRHVRPMIDIIHRSGGYARIHAHGRISQVLDDICGMGADAIDPIEPPPQGDVLLHEVRQRYGRQLVLFGNLEITDIENLPTPRFAEVVKRSLAAGTSGEGRGFVLMPSACPYGRKLSALARRNYETMIELATGKAD